MKEQATHGVKSVIDLEGATGVGVKRRERFAPFGSVAKFRERKRSADSL